MDFREFRQGIVQVPITFTDGAGEVEFWVGYRPREMVEEDLELMGRLIAARVKPADPKPQPNRAQRRANSKAKPKRTPPSEPAELTLIDHMERLIASWSLTWDDEPWPATRENFLQIEPLMRAAILGAIVTHYLERPNHAHSSSLSSADPASGPTGQTSVSEPSSGAADNSPGTT